MNSRPAWSAGEPRSDVRFSGGNQLGNRTIRRRSAILRRTRLTADEGMPPSLRGQGGGTWSPRRWTPRPLICQPVAEPRAPTPVLGLPAQLVDAEHLSCSPGQNCPIPEGAVGELDRNPGQPLLRRKRPSSELQRRRVIAQRFG